MRFAPFLRCGLFVSIRALSASLIVGGAARGLGFRLVRVPLLALRLHCMYVGAAALYVCGISSESINLHCVNE